MKKPTGVHANATKKGGHPWPPEEKGCDVALSDSGSEVHIRLSHKKRNN